MKTALDKKISQLCNAVPDLRRFRRAAHLLNNGIKPYQRWRELQRDMPVATVRGPKSHH